MLATREQHAYAGVLMTVMVRDAWRSVERQFTYVGRSSIAVRAGYLVCRDELHARLRPRGCAIESPQRASKVLPAWPGCSEGVPKSENALRTKMLTVLRVSGLICMSCVSLGCCVYAVLPHAARDSATAQRVRCRSAGGGSLACAGLRANPDSSKP